MPKNGLCFADMYLSLFTPTKILVRLKFFLEIVEIITLSVPQFLQIPKRFYVFFTQDRIMLYEKPPPNTKPYKTIIGID